jgi:hypothetical protein
MFGNSDCPKCGTKNKSSSNFCIECGHTLQDIKSCPKCFTDAPLSAKVCPRCGHQEMLEEVKPAVLQQTGAEKGFVEVISVSEEGQSRFKATRAAAMLARRDLMEMLKSIPLTSATSVTDGMTDEDIVRSNIDGVIQYAQKISEQYYDDKGYAEVKMRVYLEKDGNGYRCILNL